MSINLSPGEQNVTRIVQASRQLAQGQDNACGTVTLTVSSATTTVAAPNCSALSAVFLFPISANAAADVARGDLYVSSTSQGQFVISHTNTTIGTRAFNWTTRGG